jgi:hypothetical protein
LPEIERLRKKRDALLAGGQADQTKAFEIQQGMPADIANSERADQNARAVGAIENATRITQASASAQNSLAALTAQINSSINEGRAVPSDLLTAVRILTQLVRDTQIAAKQAIDEARAAKTAVQINPIPR